MPKSPGFNPISPSTFPDTREDDDFQEAKATPVDYRSDQLKKFSEGFNKAGAAPFNREKKEPPRPATEEVPMPSIDDDAAIQKMHKRLLGERRLTADMDSYDKFKAFYSNRDPAWKTDMMKRYGG